MTKSVTGTLIIAKGESAMKRIAITLLAGVLLAGAATVSGQSPDPTTPPAEATVFSQLYITVLSVPGVDVTDVITLTQALIDHTAQISSVTTSQPPVDEVQPTPESTIEPEPDLTVDQENAIESALGYLDFMAFSRKGLIDQLIYEDYSRKVSTFAVDSLDVNWREQAYLMGLDYLDFDSFSRKGLIDQLIYEGFSKADATYGADAARAER